MHFLNNYLFWRSSSSKAVTVLKKYLSSRSSWSEKVFVTIRSSCSRQLTRCSTKTFFKNVAASIGCSHFSVIDPALNIQLLRWEDCFTLIDFLKYTKTKCVGKIEWVQILTSEKCTVFSEEWMAVKLFSNIYSTSPKTLSWNQLFWKQACHCLRNYSNNGWLQVLPWNFYLFIYLCIYLFIYFSWFWEQASF